MWVSERKPLGRCQWIQQGKKARSRPIGKVLVIVLVVCQTLVVPPDHIDCVALGIRLIAPRIIYSPFIGSQIFKKRLIYSPTNYTAGFCIMFY